MNVSHLDRRVLDALYTGDPLSVPELAGHLALPAGEIRRSLLKLRRHRLVEERLTRRAHEFRITDRGLGFLSTERQMELGL